MSSSSSQVKAMYRRCLRMLPNLEGRRRRRLCAFRTKDILSRALKERSDSDKVQMHLVEADIYLDQISEQTTHLRHLATEEQSKLLVPVDLYESGTSRKVILDALPGRRLDREEKLGDPSAVLGGRLFQGPEPSWLRRDKEKKTVELQTEVKARQRK